MAMELVKTRSTVGSSNIHFQFTPKYRRDVFVDGKVKDACVQAFMETAEKLGVQVHACEFGPDHSHLFVGNCMKYAVPYLAQMFKGYSSRKIRGECGENLKSRLWGDSFWSDGYFHEYIGRFTNDAMRYYIERQQGKHWYGTDYDFHRHQKVQKEQAPTLADFL